jgi:hypothetical protein
MAPVSGIQRRVSIAAALSLLVAGAILIVALPAAADTRAASRVLRSRMNMVAVWLADARRQMGILSPAGRR